MSDDPLFFIFAETLVHSFKVAIGSFLFFTGLIVLIHIFGRDPQE